jgi:hypothetical protein
VSWSEIPAELQAAFRQRFMAVRDEVSMRSLHLFLHFDGDRLQMNWEMPARAHSNEIEVRLPAAPADEFQGLMGKPLPDLEVEEATGQAAVFRPRGPALLYVAPAWPRPVVAEREEFPDLKALAGLTGLSVTVLGTEATGAGLRELWKERGLNVSPLALRPASARIPAS